jgi:hypothetical protein
MRRVCAPAKNKKRGLWRNPEKLRRNEKRVGAIGFPLSSPLSFLSSPPRPSFKTDGVQPVRRSGGPVLLFETTTLDSRFRRNDDNNGNLLFFVMPAQAGIHAFLFAS